MSELSPLRDPAGPASQIGGRETDSVLIWDVSSVNSVLWRTEGRENGKKGIGQK